MHAVMRLKYEDVATEEGFVSLFEDELAPRGVASQGCNGWHDGIEWVRTSFAFPRIVAMTKNMFDALGLRHDSLSNRQALQLSRQPMEELVDF
jgi:hypothetical protein